MNEAKKSPESQGVILGKVLKIAPMVSEKLVFNYTGLIDLPNLIRFVGKTPLINSDMSLQFKKQIVKAGDTLEVNSFGEVIKIYSQDELKASWELKGVMDFSDEHVNKIREKPPQVRKPKSK
jgi:hypothetical protein